jgi:undecaprenyl-diphosphatase
MPGFEEVLCLGLLQGLTEFLPLSSSGHVALAETLFDVGAGASHLDDAERLTLHAFLHAGTLLAALLYFHERLISNFVGLWHSLRIGRLPGPNAPGGDLTVMAVASVPALLAGALLQPALDRWQSHPLAIGFGLILTALCLTSTLFTSRVPSTGGARSAGRTTLSLRGAALLGLAQSLAWLPGLSRSGVSLTSALWLGVRPERAFELGILATLPVLLGTVVLDVISAERLTGSPLLLLSGALMALGAGLLALFGLRRLMQHGQLAWCALWLLPVALASLALAKAWPR